MDTCPSIIYVPGARAKLIGSFLSQAVEPPSFAVSATGHHQTYDSWYMSINNDLFAFPFAACLRRSLTLKAQLIPMLTY